MKRSVMSSTSTSNDTLSITLALSCLFIILFTGLFAPPAASTLREYRTDVLRVLSGEAYGSCMIFVNAMHNSLDCPKGGQQGWWVSLDCDGKYGSTINARESLDQATLSMLMERKLSVRIDDREKIDGYCVAQQTILWR